ncbi:hypothetical protein [Wenjunlia tyrosinilytica]|uniref:Uncharacterized protein n=1 Tax=Wenjunlia tyrosinilytica TaxID=1544741 RepID=A0A917ZYN8_9ACTN|nr:hypothetical protein [Wenjunlia tyrosinilytica]GGP00828.1 hypothetical protein GCM10012280_70430 [Wenjunlia tyrosinilytica]
MSQRMHSSAPRPASVEPESLAELVGDCVRMARHWPVPHTPPIAPPTPWERIHGVRVSDSSAHLLDGMSDYGD